MLTPDDQALHAALRALPGRRAPASLQRSVLAAVRAEQRLPWWQRSYRVWPLWARILIPALLVLIGLWVASLLSSTVPVAAAHAQHTLASLLAPLSWVPTLTDALRHLILTSYNEAPHLWLAGAAALLGGTFVSILLITASGSALLRLARTHDRTPFAS